MSQRKKEGTKAEGPTPALGLPGALDGTGEGPSAGSPKWVVLYLHSPREKHWGRLLQMDAAGLWLRGIELASFDAWARQVASSEQGHLGPSTFFVPHLRVEKVVLDERVGPVPSMWERFESMAGQSPEVVLDGER